MDIPWTIHFCYGNHGKHPGTFGNAAASASKYINFNIFRPTSYGYCGYLCVDFWDDSKVARSSGSSGPVFKEISPITCKLEKFCFYTFGDTAIWILVVFTLDRFLALVFPLSVKEICLPSRSKYNSLLVLILSICKNFHVFWTRGPEYETV